MLFRLMLIHIEKTAAEIYKEHAEDLGPVAQSMDGVILKDQHACNLFNVSVSTF